MTIHWEQIAEALHEAGLFTELSSKVHARAMFMCEYCDQFILEQLDSWQGSACYHILPKSVYANLTEDENNLALSCKACNDLKRDWDVVRNERGHYLSLSELTPEQRVDFICLCRKELEQKRQESQNIIDQVRQILLKHNQKPATEPIGG